MGCAWISTGLKPRDLQEQVEKWRHTSFFHCQKSSFNNIRIPDDNFQHNRLHMNPLSNLSMYTF